MATHGEGGIFLLKYYLEPTNNAKNFVRWLTDEQ
jgi:hypothetical protein